MKEVKENIWGSHSFWMILCCAIPLVGIIILSLLGILGSWGFYALILLYPFTSFIFHEEDGLQGYAQGIQQESFDGAGKIEAGKVCGDR